MHPNVDLVVTTGIFHLHILNTGPGDTLAHLHLTHLHLHFSVQSQFSPSRFIVKRPFIKARQIRGVLKDGHLN